MVATTLAAALASAGPDDVTLGVGIAAGVGATEGYAGVFRPFGPGSGAVELLSPRCGPGDAGPHETAACPLDRQCLALGSAAAVTGLAGLVP